MKQEMINTLTTCFAQTTPIYNDKMTFPQIVYSQEFPQGSCPRKESYPWVDFRLPDNLPGKENIRRRTQAAVKILDREPLSFSTPPAQPVHSIPLQMTRVE
jgi:hypothetical protein